MAVKKRILLNWWYDRRDLLEPFVKLSGEFDFTCIFYKKPSERERGVPFPCLFWADYSSPQELLAKARPDEVIFFSIEDSPYQIALNLVCQQEGIVTTLVDHGLRGFGKINPPKFVPDAYKPQAMLFLLQAARVSGFRVWSNILKLLAFKLTGSMAGRTDPDLAALRRANRYICFSAANADFFVRRDKVDPNQIHLIGNPSFDTFYNSKPASGGTAKYFLLIDQPLARSSFNHSLFSEAEKTAFLNKLNRFCLAEGAKLFIKLHPDDFPFPDLVRHENICYFREADAGKLIWQSQGVFGFYSTLLLPALQAKKCILFKLKGAPLQQNWADMGMTKLLDFRAFQVSDLDFDLVEKTAENTDKFVQAYLYKTDGQALNRLRNLLLPPQTHSKLG